MKRVIICILTVTLLIGALAVPSFAAEYTNFFDILDFTSANGEDNFHGLAVGDNYFYFELPDEIIPYGFDVLVSSSSPIDSAFVSFGSNRYQLSVLSIGDGLYRLIGDFVLYNLSGISLTVNVSAGGWIQFHSFKVFTIPTTSFDVPADGVVSYAGGEEVYFHYNSDDDRESALLYGSSSMDYQQFDASIYIDDFAMYDRIDLQFYLSETAADSISISCHGENIPFTISPIQGDNSFNRYLINLSIDCTGLSPLAAPLEIVILGNVVGLDNRVGMISILYSTGFVFASEPSENLFFFNKLKQFFIDQYNNLSGWISGAGSSITTQIQQIEDRVLYAITVWSDLINNSIGSVGSKIDYWGQQIVDAIVGQKSDDTTVSDAIENQEQVNQEVNSQLQSAVGSWSDNVGEVTQGFNLALTNATPALIWISGMAQNVFSGMGWFGNVFFFLGFLHVFFLLFSKSGIGGAVDRHERRGDD